MEEIKVLCLGREMELGNLYDCRKEQLISGSLWNLTKIDQHRKIPKYNCEPTSDFAFVAEDTATTNTTAVDLHGTLKLSFLGGLVDVNGAAKYLYNNHNSINQARVVLKYSCRSGIEKLTDIEKMVADNDSVFENQLATHVVTEVEYGADAFFVFTREVRNLDDRLKFECSLKCAIGEYVPIKSGTVEIGATVNKTVNEEVTKFICSFHGDISLPTITLTYIDALDVCKRLPQMIADKRRPDGVLYGLPKVAHLYPLRRLDPRAAVVVHTISTAAMRETELFLDDFRSHLAEANALEGAKIYQKFTAIHQTIKKFRNYLQQFLEEFQKRLAELLPKIHDGKSEETLLFGLISNVKASPFNVQLLEKWITARKRELSALETYVSEFEERKIEIACREGDLERYIHKKEFRYVLVFSFERLALGSAGTDLFGQFEKFSMQHDSTTNVTNNNIDLNSWCDDEDITSHLRKQMDLFCDFVRVNNDQVANPSLYKKDLKCFAATISTSTEKAGTVYLYSDGKKRVYPIPSVPTSPHICKSGSLYRFIVSWKAPENGVESVTHYKVYYRRTSRSVTRPFLAWFAWLPEKVVDPISNFILPNTFLEFSETWQSKITSGAETELEFYFQMSTDYEFQFQVSAMTEVGETLGSTVLQIYHGGWKRCDHN